MFQYVTSFSLRWLIFRIFFVWSNNTMAVFSLDYFHKLKIMLCLSQPPPTLPHALDLSNCHFMRCLKLPNRTSTTTCSLQQMSGLNDEKRTNVIDRISNQNVHNRRNLLTAIFVYLLCVKVGSFITANWYKGMSTNVHVTVIPLSNLPYHH